MQFAESERMTKFLEWYNDNLNRILPFNALPRPTHLPIFAAVLIAASGILPDWISLLLCPVVCIGSVWPFPMVTLASINIVVIRFGSTRISIRLDGSVGD